MKINMLHAFDLFSKPEYLKNPFNFIGGKDKLLPQIYDNFNWDCKTLIEPFAGSAVVSANFGHNFDKVILNDGCYQLIRTIQEFYKKDTKDIEELIDFTIDAFELSKTNKEGYLELREHYNEYFSEPNCFNPILFYCLVTHSFNHMIHINSSGGFSVPFGANRSYFSNSLREKLVKYCHAIKKLDIQFYSEDFEELFDCIEAGGMALSDCFLYIDPPYLASDSAYSRIYGLKWTEEKEKALYRRIDEISELGGKFLLSNVVENNGNKNEILEKWMKNYEVVEVEKEYKNCNHQRKNKGFTREVLVRNY